MSKMLQVGSLKSLVYPDKCSLTPGDRSTLNHRMYQMSAFNHNQGDYLWVMTRFFYFNGMYHAMACLLYMEGLMYSDGNIKITRSPGPNNLVVTINILHNGELLSR